MPGFFPLFQVTSSLPCKHFSVFIWSLYQTCGLRSIQFRTTLLISNSKASSWIQNYSRWRQVRCLELAAGNYGLNTDILIYHFLPQGWGVCTFSTCSSGELPDWLILAGSLEGFANESGISYICIKTFLFMTGWLLQVSGSPVGSFNMSCKEPQIVTLI